MAFLRPDRAHPQTVTLVGDGIELRPPRITDYAPWAELRTASRVHLAPWEPRWARDELTKSGFRRRLRFYERQARDDRGYAFLIFSTTNGMLIGGVTLSNVRRGVCQSAMLGYWLGVGYVGQGYMKRAVDTVLPFVFTTLKLHRLEAATQAHNMPSIGVLERNGFELEGRLKSYLKMDGVWQDHLLYARISEEEQL